MSLDSDVLDVLQADSGVLALVPASRIWGGRAKDNPTSADYPHIVCRMVDDTPEMATTTGTLLMRRARMQVESFALTRAVAKELAEAVVDALQGYIGSSINDCQFEMQVELYDDQLAAWSVPTDFMILHEG